MNIFDYAMQMERDGEKYYREIAGKSSDKGLAAVMNLLADEEVKHYEILEGLRTGVPELEETRVLDDARNIFLQLRDQGVTFEKEEPQIAMYKKAREIEELSVKFYREKSAEVDDPARKRILERLAAEEERHFFLMENLVRMLGQPYTWLENAEFVKLERY